MNVVRFTVPEGSRAVVLGTIDRLIKEDNEQKNLPDEFVWVLRCIEENLR